MAGPECRCDACGQRLRPGQVGYRLRIELTADDGGWVPEPGRLEGEENWDELMDVISRRAASELEDEVRQVIERWLCPACRRLFVSGLPGLAAERFEP